MSQTDSVHVPLTKSRFTKSDEFSKEKDTKKKEKEKGRIA